MPIPSLVDQLFEKPSLTEQLSDEAARETPSYTYNLPKTNYDDLMASASEEHGVPYEVLYRNIKQESNFNPKAVSKTGARGIAQFIPSTAKAMGIKDPHDPKEAIPASAKYLKQLYDQFGDWKLAVAAYNAGPTAIRNAKGIPNIKETQDHVKAVFPDDDTTPTMKEPAPEQIGSLVDQLFAEPEKVSEVAPVPTIVPETDAKRFYSRPGITPYIMGKMNFGPKPEGGWDEHGRALDATGEPYQKGGVDTTVVGKAISETLKGLTSFATYPMEVVRGGIDFALSLPAFGVGLLGAAGRGGRELIDQLAYGDLNLDKVYGAMSKGMQESFEFFEPGKEMVVGEPTSESQMVGQVAMAPLTLLSATGHKVSSYEGFKDYPNIKGAAKIIGDGLGMMTMGLLLHGPSRRVEFAKEVEGITKEAETIIIKEAEANQSIDTIVKNIQLKTIQVEKQRLESKAALFARKFQDDMSITEEMGRQAEELAKEKIRPVVESRPEMAEGYVAKPVKLTKVEAAREAKKATEPTVESIQAAIDADPSLNDIVQIDAVGAKGTTLKPGDVQVTVIGEHPAQGGSFSVKGGVEEIKSRLEDEGKKWSKTTKKEPIVEVKKRPKVEEPIIEPPEEGLSPGAKRALDELIAEDEKSEPKPGIDYFGEGKEPITDIDRQSGVKVPEIEEPNGLFFQNREKSDSLAAIYKEREKSVSEDPEIYVQKLINDVNLWYHGKDIDINAVRGKLSEMAARSNELRDFFMTGADHLQFTDVVREAAGWARRVERSTSNKFYSGIPVDLAYERMKRGISRIMESIKRGGINESAKDTILEGYSLLNKDLDAGSKWLVANWETVWPIVKNNNLDRTPLKIAADYILDRNIEIENLDMKNRAIQLGNRASGKIIDLSPNQLNMMIPLDKIPEMAKRALRSIYPGMSKISMKDVYRNKKLYDITGLWIGRDNKWRYELDDSMMKIKVDSIDANRESIPLTEVIDAPGLFSRFPKLEGSKIFPLEHPDVLGAVSKEGNIRINTKANAEWIKSIVVHEIQHFINQETGAFEGSNIATESTKVMVNRLQSIIEGIKDERSKITLGNVRDRLERTKNMEAFYTDVVPLLEKNKNILGLSDDNIKALSFPTGGKVMYKVIPGEMEARLSSYRRHLTASERRIEPPWVSLDKMLTEEGIMPQHGVRLYSGIPLEVIVAGARKVAEYTAKARGLKQIKLGHAAKMLREEFSRSFIDRSGNIRTELLDKLGDEGYRILQGMVLEKGSSSRAALMLKQMRDEIYNGLGSQEKKILDDIILDDRMIDIGKYKNESEFKHPKGLKLNDFIAHRELFPQLEKLTPEVAADLSRRAAGYFEWMKRPLKDMLESGLISQEEYNNLASHNYRRIKLVEIFDKRYTTKVGKKSMTVYDSGVEALQRGRDTDIYEPSSEIMALEVFNRSYGRILRNEANKTLLDLTAKDPLNDFVRAKTKDGERIPSGWARIFVFDKGERKSLYISPEMSKEWIHSSPEMSYKMSQIVRWLSGSVVTRTFATGIEWGFALANLPRDMMHLWFAARTFENGKWKPLYNPNLPIYGLQIGRDLATVFTDASLRRGRYNDYINEGGGMEFLVHQGRLFQRGRHLEGPMDRIYDFLGYLGETSEILTRLAIRERALRKGKSVTEATFAARDYMDFGQGGGVSKALDNGMPYLNASIQGTRGLIRTLKPGSGSALSSAYKLAQLATVTTGIYVAAKASSPKTMEALTGDVAMQNNLCVPIGDSFAFEDEKGQIRYIYLKIPLDPGQKFFKTFFEASADKWLGNEIDIDRVTGSLKELSPVGISSLPPTISGVLGYATNKDFWLNEDIWKRTDKPFNFPQSKEEYTSGTPQSYVDIGKVTGLSPERTKYAVEELVTGGSMWSYLVNQGYDAAFKDMPKDKKEKHLAQVLSEMPVIKRFVGITKPYAKYAAKIDRAEEANTVERFIQTRGMDTLVEGYLYGKNIQREEIFKYAQSFKDKDTYDRLIDRFKWEESIKDLPEKSFWRRIKGLNTEVKAQMFVYRLNNADDVGKKQLWKEYAVVANAGGVLSDEFRSEVMKLMAGKR